MADLQTAFLLSMAVVIAVAAVIVVLFHRFRQPLILGYLVAGMVAGPFVTSIEVTPAADIEMRDFVELLARLGIILITFSIGLEFSLRQLRKIGITVIAAAALEIAIMIGIGFQLGLALWGRDKTLEASLLGAMLSVASTMIIVRSLKESGGLDNEKARLIIGLLVVEDMAAVLILASVSGLVASGQVDPTELFWLVLKMLAFIALAIVAGLAVVPRLVDYVGRQRSNELLVITSLGLAFSMAIFSRWVGFSEAIGAFVMGVIVSESRYVGDVVRRVEPVRDLFGAMFFISVGMLVDPEFFTDTGFLFTALIITAVFVISKMLACSLSSFVCGFGARNSLGAGLGMIAIGEFSLMIAAVAMDADIDPSIYNTVVLVTTLTALIVPYSIRYTDKTTASLERHAPRSLMVVISYFNLVVRNIRRRSGSSARLSNEIRNSISRLFVYIVAMITVVALAFNALPRAEEYAYIFGGNEDATLGAIVAATIVTVIYGMVGVWRRTIRIIEVATSEAMLSTRSAENIGYQATAGSLRYAFLAFYVLIGFIAVAPLVRSVVEQNILFVVVTASIVVVSIVALWGSVQTLDRKLDEIFESRNASPNVETARDLAEIEDIIAAMEGGKP